MRKEKIQVTLTSDLIEKLRNYSDNVGIPVSAVVQLYLSKAFTPKEKTTA